MSTPRPEPDRAPFPESALDVEPLRAAWVRALAARLVRDGHAADDLAQDAWIAGARAAPQDEPSFRNWIATVVARLATKRVRGETNRAARERSVARREALEPADEVVERAETHRALVQSVLALEEPYRSTLLLRYFDELSPSAIAARQGVPVRTVKTRLARGLERLRERLDREHRGGRSQWLAALMPLVETSTLVPATVGTVLLKTKLVTALGAAALIACVAWLSYRGTHDEPADAALAEHAIATPAQLPDLSAGGPGTAGRAPAAGAALVPRAEPMVRDPERTLSGTVVDSHGNPIAGAHVVLFRSRKSALGRNTHPLPETKPLVETTSDALGVFDLPVERGPALDLRIEADGFAPHDSSMRHAGEQVVIVLTRPARISGRVTRAADGSALAGAIIRAGTLRVDRSWREVETDADGTYEIAYLPAGELQLTVDDVRTVTARTGAFLVAEGETVVRDFALAAGSVARGIVTDASSGAPIAGARVARSVHEFDGGPCAVTDPSGTYVLAGLEGWGASVAIHVRAEGFALGSAHRPLEPAITADFTLERGNGARGRVLDAAGWPLSGVEVTAIGSTDAANPLHVFFDIRTTRTGSDGTFVLADLRRDVAHDLRLLADGHGDRNYAFPEDEGEIEQIDFGDLRLSDPGVITARVVDARGAPLVGWWVRVYGGNTDRLHFTEGTRDIRPRTNLHEGITDERGQFTLGDLAPGPYLANVSLKGSTAFVERELVLGEGEHADLGDLTIDVGLSIDGVVVDADGRPIAGATVEVYRQPELLHRVTYTLADVNGRFALRGLAEGLHDLELAASAFAMPGRALYARSWTRDIAAGTHGLRLVPERSVPIRGVVFDPAGGPAADVYVDAFEVGSDPEGWAIASLRTDSRGSFELPVVGGRRYVLHAFDDRSEAGRANAAATAVDVLAGTDRVELRLIPR